MCSNLLKLFSDSQLNVAEDLLNIITHNDPNHVTIQELLLLRFNYNTEQYEVLVQWKRFDYKDPTWSQSYSRKKTSLVC